MERHMRLSRAAVVLVTIALIAAIAAAVWFASPDTPYVPSEDSGAALGTAAPAEDGTVASGYQPSGTAISDETDGSAIQTIRNSKNGTYHLTKDIVVNSLTDCEFSGTLDGNGKTVYIRYDSEVTGEPGVNTELGIGALFGNLNGATIKNVKIVVETFRYVEGSAGTRNVGIIAGDAWGGVKIENVYVKLQYSPDSDGRSYFLDSGVHSGSWTGTKEVELNFGAVLGKSGSSVADTDVTLKNVTVDNQTSGNYGFSAWIRHGDDCNYKVSMGHFVGWVTGELSMQNCTLRGGESAKMTIKRGGSGGRTTNQSGAVIGRLDEQSGSKPSLTIAGLDMEMAINFGTYKVMNIDIGGNNGIIYGNDADNSCTVNVKDIYWNQNSGDPGWYDGDDQTQITYDNLTKYDPNTIGVSFDKDGDKVLLSAKAQYIDKAEINSITFNNVSYPVWDKLIATDTKAVGQWTQVVTVAKPNLKTGGSITYTTEMGTGTFTIEGGETITGVSGNAYTATREYDGNPPQSPSIVLSGGGGSFGEVWKAEGASANVGQYTMTFDKSVLTAAGSVVAAGSDGLTYIAKNGIVYSPGSMEQIGQLNIVNNINVNITQASVEVTTNVPTDNLYTGNRLPELTATAVDSGGKAVEGDIVWDEPDATLISGTHSYNWTWTPNSDNYQTKTGSIELEAFDRKIQSLSVQGDFKTAYTAYEPFDPRGVEVIAHYSDGTTAVLTDEYAFKIVGADGNEVEGGIDKLFVAYKEVTVYLLSGSEATTTISIDVDYVRFAVEQKAYNKDITYGDSYQWNAADFYTWSDNTEVVETYMDFYEVGSDLTDDISGIATADAGTEFTGRVLGRAFYQGEEVPEAEYDNFIGINDPDVIATEVTLTIVPREVEIESSGIDSGAYSGEPVDLSTLFTAPNGVNDEGALQLEFVITVDDENSNEILNAGTYSVTASLAESETNYTAKPVTITYTVTKLAIPKPQDAEEPIVYDGTEHDVTPTVPEYKVVNGTTKETDAGNYSFTIALADKANTEWEGGTSDDITVTWSITPATVKITGEDSSKTYDGQEVDPRRLFTASNGVDGRPIELTVTVDGDKTILNAGTYTVSAKPTSANYAGACEVKYIIQKASPSVTVKVDTDTTYYSSQSLYDIAIKAEEPSVAGNIAWEGGQVLSAATTEYSWVFTPDDVDNYEIVTGKVTLKVENVTLNRIEVTKNPKKMSYVAYSDFDATGMIVTAYFDGAEARELSIEELTLSGNTNLQYGDGEATITITFQEKTATVTVDVTKMLIPVPKAQTGIVFDGELHTGIVEDEQWSQYYHVDAESEERYAGTYTAVVNLNDVKNTAWEGTEDSEPKEISWTIEHVTIEVTVNAESKTVEYGTAYSWNPNDFFAVEVTNSDLFEVKLGVFDDDSITDISTANVGEYREGIFASVTRKDGGALEEQDLGSFEFSQDIKQLVMKVIVTAKAVAKPVVDTTVFDATGGTITLPIAESEYYNIYGNTAIEPGRYVATVELNDPANTMWEDGSTDVVSIAWTIAEPVTSDEVIADILAMEKVTWQNAEEFLDLEARYNALDESEQTAEATAKIAVLRAQYDALRNAAFDDIEAAHEVTAKSLGKALAAAAAGLSAAAIALAIAKRRSI